MRYFYYFCILGLIYVQTNFVASNNFGSCLTPNNQNGTCVLINQCPELNNLLQKDYYTEDEDSLLLENMCSNVDADDEIVCCPSVSPSVPLLPKFPECGVVDMEDHRFIWKNENSIWEYPWMALLLYTRSANSPVIGCGGVLINKRYVLTAAHCLSPIRRSRKIHQLSTVRLGEWDTSTTTDIDDDGEIGDPVLDIGIEEKIVHEFYDRSVWLSYNNIALLRLARDVEYTRFIKPICIHRTDDLLNKDLSTVEMLATGLGINEDNTVGTKKLTVSLLGKNPGTCQLKYTPFKIILQDTVLCAGGDTPRDTCIGDPGGPLVLLDRNTIPKHFHLIGVWSFGTMPCGRQNFPIVYTKVANYVTWIESNLRP